MKRLWKLENGDYRMEEREREWVIVRENVDTIPLGPRYNSHPIHVASCECARKCPGCTRCHHLQSTLRRRSKYLGNYHFCDRVRIVYVQSFYGAVKASCAVPALPFITVSNTKGEVRRLSLISTVTKLHIPHCENVLGRRVECSQNLTSKLLSILFSIVAFRQFYFVSALIAAEHT